MLDGLPPPDVLMNQSTAELQEQVEYLEKAVCTTDDEAVSVLFLSCLQGNVNIDGNERAKLEKRLFALVRRMIEGHDTQQIVHLLERLTALEASLGDTGSPLYDRLSSFLMIAYDKTQEDSGE